MLAYLPLFLLYPLLPDEILSTAKSHSMFLCFFSLKAGVNQWQVLPSSAFHPFLLCWCCPPFSPAFLPFDVELKINYSWSSPAGLLSGWEIPINRRTAFYHSVSCWWYRTTSRFSAWNLFALKGGLLNWINGFLFFGGVEQEDWREGDGSGRRRESWNKSQNI